MLRGCSAEMEDMNFRLLEKETRISELEYENKLLEDKLKKMKLKKEVFDEQMSAMKYELSELQLKLQVMKSSTRNGKKFAMALMVSWIMFVVVYLVN